MRPCLKWNGGSATRVHPVSCMLIMIAVLFWRQPYFYWVHRLIHVSVRNNLNMSKIHLGSSTGFTESVRDVQSSKEDLWGSESRNGRHVS
jgi:hypothetical protein